MAKVYLILSGLLLLSSAILSMPAKKDEINNELIELCTKSGGDNVEEIERTLNVGADINIKDTKSGQTCLMASILRGKLNTVKLLLQLEADLTIGEKDGYLPAHGAAFQGRNEIMKVLIEKGVDVNMEHSDGYRPIHRTCWQRSKGHTQTFSTLVKIAGVDPFVKSQNGRTCEDMTTNEDIIQMLQEWKDIEF